MIVLFFECIPCKNLKNGCSGPDFSRRSSAEIIEWFKAYCSHFGISHSAFAKQCGIAEGTIHRVFSGASVDIKFETFRAMYVGVFGKEPPAAICPDPDGSVTEKLTDRVRHLEGELEHTRSLAARNDARDADQIAHLKSQANNLRKALSIMTALLIVVLFAIICVLLYDINHLDFGYFRG